jgi:carboxymethylenebutenolidase
MKLTPVIDLAENMACPLLGLFGLDDQFPSSEEVDEIDAELTRLGKDHEFHRYEGAGHAFFNTARDSYRPAAATDGWERIFDFYGRHLVS